MSSSSISDPPELVSSSSTESIPTTQPVPKRAKIRPARAVTIQPKPAPFLTLLQTEPKHPTVNPFNVSEVIKDFLYIGAGYDCNGRMVTTLPNSPDDEDGSRLKWWTEKKCKFALNMAGSPLQTELQGIEYPAGVDSLTLDVNDIEEWQGEKMRVAFQQGAEYIERCYKQRGEGASIFVHCVAGVNRSPFVVVWWLVKMHNIHPNFAYDLVRIRRDLAVGWRDETLGGSLVEQRAEKSRRKWFEAMLSNDV